MEKARWGRHFQRPLYTDFSFSSLSDTIIDLLTGEGAHPLDPSVVEGRYEMVTLFLIDGFGWEFFKRYQSRYPALQRFIDGGVVSCLSSEFPSTTAAHLTSLHAGQEVGETGIYEWFQYEPLVDRMVAPLLCSYAGAQEAGELIQEGYKAHALLPFETLYQKLKKRGVRSVVLQQEKIAHSPYSKAMLAGAEVIPFGSFAEALEKSAVLMQQACLEPTYLFVYFGEIDAVGHRQGIDSAAFDEAVDRCWTLVEEKLWNQLTPTPHKRALLFTADHGMVPVDPKQTLFLNVLDPELPRCIRKNRQGELLVPAGSCRDFFLHIEPTHLERSAQVLQEKLFGLAEVLPVSTLIAEGFFGSRPVSPRFLERVGNLVVLPYAGENVFWKFEGHRFQQHFHGAHGGLTPEEMTTILLFHEV